MDNLSTAPAARIRARSWLRPASSWAVLPCLAAVLTTACSGHRPQAPIVITNFGPTQGLAGTNVILIGTGMAATSFVSFGDGEAKAFTILSGTEISATVPASATTGPITVNGNQNVYSTPTNFTVLPQIVGVVPASGPLGTEVKVTGSGFAGTTQVLFGAEPASGAGSAFTVEGPNQINVIIGSDATTGPVQITVGTSTVTGPTFTVTPQPAS